MASFGRNFWKTIIHPPPPTHTHTHTHLFICNLTIISEFYQTVFVSALSFWSICFTLSQVIRSAPTMDEVSPLLTPITTCIPITAQWITTELGGMLHATARTRMVATTKEVLDLPVRALNGPLGRAATTPWWKQRWKCAQFKCYWKWCLKGQNIMNENLKHNLKVYRSTCKIKWISQNLAETINKFSSFWYTFNELETVEHS